MTYDIMEDIEMIEKELEYVKSNSNYIIGGWEISLIKLRKLIREHIVKHEEKK